MSRSGKEDISGLVGEELPYLGDVVDVTGSPAGNQKLYRQGAGATLRLVLTRPELVLSLKCEQEPKIFKLLQFT